MGAGSCSHRWTVRVGPPDGAGLEVKPRNGWRMDLSGKRLEDASQVSALGHLVDHGVNSQDEKGREGPCSRLLHAHRRRGWGAAPGRVRTTEMGQKAGTQEPGP